MAVHYDISSLDSNKTILETLHDIQKYLKANPIYKVYYANGSYTIGQTQYSISLLGNNQGQIAEGDVVFFNNNFYAKISSVGTETFSVFPATAIQGSGGAQIKTMTQLEFLTVVSLLYDVNAGAHINMSGRTEYEDGTETPNSLEVLIPFVPKDNSIEFETSDNFEQVKVSLNSKVISNPNLLINSNFAINQRGQSSYTANNKYTVDRWLIYANDNVTVQPQLNGGLKVQNAGSNNTADLTQIIEEGSKLYSGKELTLSVNTTIGGNTATTILSGTLSSAGTLTADLSDSSGQIHIQLMSNGTFKVWLRTYANKTILFNWAKLEVGDIATEYTPPLIAEELPKCLRYFYRLQSTDTIFICEGHANSTTVIFAPATLPIPMRTAPSTTYSALTDFNLYGLTGSAIALTSLNTSRFDKINTKFTLNAYATGLTNDTNYIIRATNANAYIDFDAEIY